MPPKPDPVGVTMGGADCVEFDVCNWDFFSRTAFVCDGPQAEVVCRATSGAGDRQMKVRFLARSVDRRSYARPAVGVEPAEVAERPVLFRVNCRAIVSPPTAKPERWAALSWHDARTYLAAQ